MKEKANKKKFLKKLYKCADIEGFCGFHELDSNGIEVGCWDVNQEGLNLLGIDLQVCKERTFWGGYRYSIGYFFDEEYDDPELVFKFSRKESRDLYNYINKVYGNINNS